jgi:hypothetical protein
VFDTSVPNAKYSPFTLPIVNCIFQASACDPSDPKPITTGSRYGSQRRRAPWSNARADYAIGDVDNGSAALSINQNRTHSYAKSSGKSSVPVADLGAGEGLRASDKRC